MGTEQAETAETREIFPVSSADHFDRGGTGGHAAIGPVVLGPVQRAELTERARAHAERLRAEEITMVALCWVDNAGIARAKTVPIGRVL